MVHSLCRLCSGRRDDLPGGPRRGELSAHRKQVVMLLISLGGLIRLVGTIVVIVILLVAVAYSQVTPI